MDMLTDLLRDVAISYPILTGVAVLAAVWYALVSLRERSGDAAVGGSSITEEGIQKARERQQAALAQAATARAQHASSRPVASTPRSPAADAAPAGEMPERMRAANARRAAAEAGAAGTAGAAKPAHQKGANDKNSVTQRLARLQEGKGDQNSNPLMGPEAGKGSSSAKPCRKKGG